MTVHNLGNIDPRDPMTEEEIADKFTALGGDVLFELTTAR
ncbi:MAG: MmgE/PrpD family protein [Verrucomicrobiota bacterium]|nr:MmgE/PrpD family protein [Verrucomicrobiota bacterium]